MGAYSVEVAHFFDAMVAEAEADAEAWKQLKQPSVVGDEVGKFGLSRNGFGFVHEMHGFRRQRYGIKTKKPLLSGFLCDSEDHA